MGHAADTSPDAHAAQMEAYRRMGGARRVAVAFRLTDQMRRVAMAGVRNRHPDYDEEQVRQAVARLLLGDEMMLELWPDREPVLP